MYALKVLRGLGTERRCLTLCAHWMQHIKHWVISFGFTKWATFWGIFQGQAAPSQMSVGFNLERECHLQKYI